MYRYTVNGQWFKKPTLNSLIQQKGDQLTLFRDQNIHIVHPYLADNWLSKDTIPPICQP